MGAARPRPPAPRGDRRRRCPGKLPARPLGGIFRAGVAVRTSRSGEDRRGSTMSLTLVIGGIRSGKSARAEALAAATGLPVRYLATADPDDTSMRQRIADHAARRPPQWETVETGATLAEALRGPGCV